MKNSILLITCDELIKDSLSVYGNRKADGEG